MISSPKLMYTLFFYCLIAILNPAIWSGPTARAKPPPPPVQCNQTGCTLTNSYGAWGSDRDYCQVTNVTYPKTEEELRLAVAYASQHKLKVKVVSKFSHTIPKLACPGSISPGGSGANFLISTENYDTGIEVDAANLVVTAEAGVALRRLIDEVEEVGLSLVAAPAWEGVSVGGVISTGAHGSSWWGKGGAVHDHVVGIRLVVPAEASHGYAKILSLEANDPLLNAAKVSLGLLGVISKVKFSLEKGFKRSITFNFTEEVGFEDTIMDHAKKHEFADITWYPSRRTAVYRYDDRVPLNASGNGVFDFIGFRPNFILVSQAIRAKEKEVESGGNSKAKCLIANTVLGFKKLVANGLKNNGLIFTGYPVIGRNGKMQTSGSCLYSTGVDKTCAWDPRIKGLFFYETTAIFAGVSKFADFIRDVKRLRDLNPDSFCGVDMYNGFLIRFIRASEAYLGQDEDSVVVDFNYYRADEPSTPRLNQDVWEEVEQMAFFKYGARPHWAKNRDLAFLGVTKKYAKFGKFVEAKRNLDPQNLFSNDWSDEVLFGKQMDERGDGCALEGKCVCSEDRHCSPGEGYFCKEGLVFKEARVCKRFQSSVS